MRNPLLTRPGRYIKALLCAAVTLIYTGGVYAQTGRVIFPAREVTVKKALDEIARQTSYKPMADWSLLDQNRNTLLSDNVLAVGDLLNQVLSGTGCTYVVDGKQIFFKADQENDPGASRLHVPDNREVNARSIVAGRRTGYWSSTGNDGESIDIVMVNFRVNRSLLERGFMNNDYSLSVLDRTLSDLSLTSDVDYLTITAASSPEGNTKLNEKLAEERAMAIKSYIMWKHPHFDRSRILTYAVGEDWPGLKKMVEDDTATPGRREILELLGGNATNDAKKKRLRTVENGRAYAYIAKNMLPYLRGGAACMIYYKSDPLVPDTAAAVAEPEIRYVDRVRVDTVFIDRERVTVVPVEAPRGGKPYYLALKTNLLYNAVLLPNVAVEFSLPRRWSVELEGHWSWWNTNTGKHYYHRVQVGGLEVRKWLGSSGSTPFKGHYFGVYGMSGNYDIRFGNIGRLAESGSWSAGVSYGFATPISRSFNFELGIGIGYFGGEYKRYTYDSRYDRYPWQSDHTRSYFGPTKAKASLVWLVGSGKNRK